jgi:hypothetical protein
LDECEKEKEKEKRKRKKKNHQKTVKNIKNTMKKI